MILQHLVAHREFIDLRTYVFQHGASEYTRTRFYVNGPGVKYGITF